MKPRIITISREYGSGGCEIGRQLAKHLGLAFYDKELFNTAAREGGVSPEYVSEFEETRNPMPFFDVLNRTEPAGEGYLAPPTIQDRMYAAQSDFIKQAAEKSPCVIVGRAADFVLASRKDCLNVYIYADLEARVRRVMDRSGVDEGEARKKIARVDRARAAYYHYYTGRQWGLAKNYHISLDSGFLGIEGCVKTIANRVPPEWKPHEVRAC